MKSADTLTTASIKFLLPMEWLVTNFLTIAAGDSNAMGCRCTAPTLMLTGTQMI